MKRFAGLYLSDEQLMKPTISYEKYSEHKWDFGSLLNYLIKNESGTNDNQRFQNASKILKVRHLNFTDVS